MVIFNINHLFNTHHLRIVFHILTAACALFFLIGCGQLSEHVDQESPLSAIDSEFSLETLAMIQEIETLTNLFRTFIFSPNSHGSMIDMSAMSWQNPQIPDMGTPIFYGRDYSYIFDSRINYGNDDQVWYLYSDEVGLVDPDTQSPVEGTILLSILEDTVRLENDVFTSLLALDFHTLYELQGYNLYDQRVEVSQFSMHWANDGEYSHWYKNQYDVNGDMVIIGTNGSDSYFYIDDYSLFLYDAYDAKQLPNVAGDFELSAYELILTIPFIYSDGDSELTGELTFEWSGGWFGTLDVSGSLQENGQVIAGFSYDGSLSDGSYRVKIIDNLGHAIVAD